jgi:hypothetical protein
VLISRGLNHLYSSSQTHIIIYIFVNLITLNEWPRYNCLKICYNEKKVLNSFRKNYLSPQITEHKKDHDNICDNMLYYYSKDNIICWKIINKMSINSENGFRLAKWTREQFYFDKFTYGSSIISIQIYIFIFRSPVTTYKYWSFGR